MRRRINVLLKRIIVAILVFALAIPMNCLGSAGDADVYAATDEKMVCFSNTDYRYMTVGESYNFNLRNKVADATYQWTSSNEKVATVNQNGVVKAKKKGTATITCLCMTTSGIYALEADIYVKAKGKKPAKSIEITNGVKNLYAGQTYELETTYGSEGVSDYINWTSSNTNVATVDEQGKVTAVSNGTATIKAVTLYGNAKDSFKVKVSDVAQVTTQEELDIALSLDEVKQINILTKEEVNFVIAEGTYAKKLVVMAPKSDVENYGKFDDIVIKSIKENTWKEMKDNGNKIQISSPKAGVYIAKDAYASISVDKRNAKVKLTIDGKAKVDITKKSMLTLEGNPEEAPIVGNNAKNTTIVTKVAIKIATKFKIQLTFASSAAFQSTISEGDVDQFDVTSEVPITKWKVGSVEIKVTLSKNVVIQNPTPTPTSSPTVAPTQTPTVAPTETPTVTPEIPESVSATFGSPRIDGTIDDCWDDAEVIVPDIYGADTFVTAEYRLMWDDNALYVLAKVKDNNLDDSNTSSYQQDSLEIFLDELYDKASTYQSDDVHYRVSYNNYRTNDNGDSTRFYTKTTPYLNESDETIGYIVEACVSWKEATPGNDMEIGLDLQVNVCENGSRKTTINIFDTTGNGYQNPSLFGKLILTGKAEGATSGVNPYPLLTYIESVEAINIDNYVNGDSLATPLAAAKEVAANLDATQEELDAALATLKAAVDDLDDGSGYTKPSKLEATLTNMPDAFTFNNGNVVMTQDDWLKRQEEIRDMYEYYVYGQYRSGETVTYELLESIQSGYWDWNSWQYVTTTEEATDTKKFVKITIALDENTSSSFIATVNLPAEGAPAHDGGYPALIEIGSLGSSVREYLLSKGYATIEFTTSDVASDDANHKGAFYTLYPYGDAYSEQTGVLMAWAWGVSKIVDTLELMDGSENDLGINPDRTIVNGVSRNGKAAAIAGAFDTRITVTAPSSSGAGGMAAFRYCSEGLTFDYSSLSLEEFIDFSGEEDGTEAYNGYQTEDGKMVTVGTNQSFTHFGQDSSGGWVIDNYKEFTDVKQFPLDQNLLAALCANEGRYLYITTEVVGGDWVNGAATYATYLEAQKIFDTLYIGDNVGTHIHSVGHAFTLMDAQYLVSFIEKNVYGAATVDMNLDDLKTSVYEDNGNREVFDTVYNTVKSPEDTTVIRNIPSEVTATFGSPYVDGVIDDCWSKATIINPTVYGKMVDVRTDYRLMWDDNVLYVLAEVLDDNLDKTNGATYQQDSLEIFMDEKFDQASSYQEDDMHYRVNYDNERSTDDGDATRFYSKTNYKYDADNNVIGYTVEACISWKDITPANAAEIGFDLQINEAENGSRVTTVNVFDTTGNAYQNPSLFGKLVLEGKEDGDISGINPYKLLTYIEKVEGINLSLYTQITADAVRVALEAAKEVANNQNSTQDAIEEALLNLQAAVTNLDDGSGYENPLKMEANKITIPDAFTFEDGTPVTTVDAWEERQEEIRDLYEYYVYGQWRSGENVTYESLESITSGYFDWSSWQYITNTEYATDTKKFIKITINANDKSSSFVATVNLPGADAPTHEGGYPVLIEIGSLGDSVRTYLNQMGYATVEFSTGDLGSDDANHTGAFYTLYPYGESYQEQTGALMSWAWGVSKIMDVLEMDSAKAILGINPENAIVNGVSRNGKAASVAGAFDTRIKVTAPSSSGAGGMAMFRYKSEGLTFDYSSLSLEEFIDFNGVEDGTESYNGYQTEEGKMSTVTTNQSFTHFGNDSSGGWVVDRYRDFTDVNQFPLDQHLLAALCANEDRYLYITTEVVGGDWVNGAATYATYLEAKKIFGALGIEDHIATHIHAVGHAFTLMDAQYLVDFVELNVFGAVTPMRDLSALDTSVYEVGGNREVFDSVYNTIISPNPVPQIVSVLKDATLGACDVNGTVVTSVSGSAIDITASEYTTTVSGTALSVTGGTVYVAGSAFGVTGGAIAVTGGAFSVTGGARTGEIEVQFDIDFVTPTINSDVVIYVADSSGNLIDKLSISTLADKKYQARMRFKYNASPYDKLNIIVTGVEQFTVDRLLRFVK